jgi:hypothetical protein
MRALTNAFDLLGCQNYRRGQARFIKLAHRCQIDGTHFLKCARRGVNHLKGLTFEFLFCCHGKSPKNPRWSPTGKPVVLSNLPRAWFHNL